MAFKKCHHTNIQLITLKIFIYIIHLKLFPVICINKESCPIGYAKIDNNCALCLAGTYVSTSGNKCEPCGPGKYSFAGSYTESSCIPCPIAFYSEKNISGICTSCPSKQITPTIKSSGSIDCFCAPGYKTQSLRNQTCIKCEVNEWCYLNKPNSGGFWNVASYCYSIGIDKIKKYPNYSTTYKICHEEQALKSPLASYILPCFGGEAQCVSLLGNSTFKEDKSINELQVAACAKGNSGILCDSCEPGYAKLIDFSGEYSSCKKCSVLNCIPLVIAQFIMLSISIYIVWILRMEPTANEEENPIAQITLIRCLIQHIQVLSLLFKFKIVDFQGYLEISKVFSLLSSEWIWNPLLQCIVSKYGIPTNGKEYLIIFTIVSAASPLILIFFSLIIAPIILYFRKREVSKFLMGRREIEGECLYFQKSFISWFMSLLIVSFFVYYTSIAQELVSVINCVGLQMNITSKAETSSSSFSSSPLLNRYDSFGQTPATVDVVSIASENTCFDSNHKIAIFIAAGSFFLWIILFPLIYAFFVQREMKTETPQRRRILFGWWSSGYEKTQRFTWELATCWRQILYLVLIITISLAPGINNSLFYYAVPGGSVYTISKVVLVATVGMFSCLAITVLYDWLYSILRPHDKDRYEAILEREDEALKQDDDEVVELQHQQQRVATGGSRVQQTYWSWPFFYYIIQRLSNFCIILLLIAVIWPRLNVNIIPFVANKRVEWTNNTEVLNILSLGYSRYSTIAIFIFAIICNYLLVGFLILLLLGIKLYKPITTLLASIKNRYKNDEYVDYSSSEIHESGNIGINYSNTSHNIKKQIYSNIDKLANLKRKHSSSLIGDSFKHVSLRFYHDMSTINTGNSGVDDDVSIEQLIRMHLRSDCLGFLSHDDRITIVSAIKRCESRPEGLAIALRVTLDSRFGPSDNYNIMLVSEELAESLRSYGFSDGNMNKLIEDLLAVHMTIVQRIKFVTSSMVKTTMELCILNYPEVAQKLGIEQIIDPSIKLHDLVNKSNAISALYIDEVSPIANVSYESGRDPKVRALIAKLSLNAIILDLSDIYFKIPRAIPVKFQLKLNRNSGLLFSELYENNELADISKDSISIFKDNANPRYHTGSKEEIYTEFEDNERIKYMKSLQMQDKTYSLPIPGYTYKEYKKPKSLDINLLLSIKKFTEIDARQVLNEIDDPLSFETTNATTEAMIKIMNVLLSTKSDSETQKFNQDSDEELIQLILGLNPTENIHKDVTLELLNSVGSLNNNIESGAKTGDLNNKSNFDIVTLQPKSIGARNIFLGNISNKAPRPSFFNSDHGLSLITGNTGDIPSLLQPYTSNLHLLRVLDLKEWLNQYKTKYLEERRSHNNIAIKQSQTVALSEERNTSFFGDTNSLYMTLSHNLDEDNSQNCCTEMASNKLEIGNEVEDYEAVEHLNSITKLTYNLNRYASPSILFYYLQLNKRLKSGLDPIVTSVIPDSVFSEGNITNEEAIQVYREIDPTLNFIDNPYGFKVAAIHEFSALNTPNINFKKCLELTIKRQRNFNLLFPNALPCIHSIFSVPFDIYDDDALWILQASKKKHQIYILDLLSKDHPQITELPYLEDDSLEINEKCYGIYSDSDENTQKVPNLELRLTDKYLLQDSLHDSNWIWKEIPLHFAVDFNGMMIRSLLTSSYVQQSIYISGNPISALGPNSPHWAYMSHKVDRSCYLNGVNTLNGPDSAIIVVPGIQTQGNNFTIEVWAKLPPLNLIQNQVGHKKNDKISIPTSSSDKELLKDSTNAINITESPTLHVLCSTDEMEGLFTIHRKTGTIGFWDSSGRFLKCVLRGNSTSNIGNGRTSATTNSAAGNVGNSILGSVPNSSSNSINKVATLSNLYRQLNIRKRSTHCKIMNQNIEQFIDFNQDPWILQPWVLIHIVYSMGLIKYFVNGVYIGSIRKLNGLKGNITIIGGSLESGSNWGYFSQFRVYGGYTSNEQILNRFESYVSSYESNSFFTKIDSIGSFVKNWILKLWRSGITGFFTWKYSNIKLTSNETTYLIDLINRNFEGLNDSEKITEVDSNTCKRGILIFGIIIRILKGERNFPYYYVYEPLPHNLSKTKSKDPVSNEYNKYNQYSIISLTPDLQCKISDDYKNINIDDMSNYKENPYLYQPNIVPGPGMVECLLLGYNTKSNNSGLLIKPSVELTTKIKKKISVIRSNQQNSSSGTDEMRETVHNGWTMTVWFHYPLLIESYLRVETETSIDCTSNAPMDSLASYNLGDSVRNETVLDTINNYTVLFCGRNDAHLAVSGTMDVGVFKGFTLKSGQKFYPSGLNLERANLPMGWHMMTVVGKPRLMYRNSKYYSATDNTEYNVKNSEADYENNNKTKKNATQNRNINLNKNNLNEDYSNINTGMEYKGLNLMNESLNITSNYTWIQEFYIDGQIMGISSYCSFDDVIMIGNSIYLENAFGIFTCPRIFNIPFDPIEVHADFISYNYLTKASSWSSTDDLLLQFDYNQIIGEFQIIQNPCNKVRYLTKITNEVGEKAIDNVALSTCRSLYWLDEIEYQSPLYSHVEIFLNTKYKDIASVYSIPGDNDTPIRLKSYGIITTHRGPTNENICIDPTQIYILEKKSGYFSEGGRILLDPPVRLSKNWTSEFWIFVPFKLTKHPYCLLSSPNGVGFIVIGLNEELGSIQKKVTLSGTNLSSRDSSENVVKIKSHSTHFMSWDINLRQHLEYGWYHIVVVFNTSQDNTITVYVNSNCIGKKNNCIELPHHQDPWISCIGNLKSPKGSYIAPFGLFGHLKIYDFALSNIEINILYKQWLSNKNIKKEIEREHNKQNKSVNTKFYSLNDQNEVPDQINTTMKRKL
ncbi:uncharacterized protein CMU_036260 [Cryptosporidium muris RN66]|uniref:Tyrosine-protein kinase ephrin type A/B receptor-like domain-containing protein n=1 Tax=Cryptosporidium muris (strain RN66) TaxID=441375 RepID=B6AGW2_CRYMR|nr:uncharacterized protein CMU_036260 [Cryptosporidium muris RN66]EEA07453.1 hypothetical protein, conserved [Cryptosporidium muris RN66]|eukprot:XP_002141802.1 hypothetical protein [Cryptosporidium muris RN66]